MRLKNLFAAFLGLFAMTNAGIRNEQPEIISHRKIKSKPNTNRNTSGKLQHIIKPFKKLVLVSRDTTKNGHSYSRLQYKLDNETARINLGKRPKMKFKRRLAIENKLKFAC
jgi:hypothetical protein